MNWSVYLAALSFICLSAPFANADNQVDKAVFYASSSPGRVGVPSVQTTGIRIAGTVDFPSSDINVWAWTTAGWQFLAAKDRQVIYSPIDSAFYGKPVYRYVVTAEKATSFTIQYIDVDFLNPFTNQRVKLSASKGYTYFSGDTLYKKQF